MNDADTLWKRCAEVLREQVSDAAWRTSLEGLHPQEMSGHTLSLSAPSNLVRERVEARFLGLITAIASDLNGSAVDVRLLVRDASSGGSDAWTHVSDAHDAQTGRIDLPMSAYESNTSPSYEAAPTPGSSATGIPVHEEQPATDATGYFETVDADGLDRRYTFEAFVIGASNRFAHAAALSVAERPAKTYNPLFIHGGAGLGKTHLLHAIGNYVRENFPGKHLRYVSTETFMNEFVDAIRNNMMPMFKRRYRECDVLLIDDVQFMEGKESLQEEFFHTFNHLYGSSKQVVLTSDRPPKSIATLEDRLRSRFLCGLITDVIPPELETRLAILHKKAEREPVPVPDEVLEFIATNVKDNIRELEGALIRVTAYGSLTGQPLSRDLAERVLSDIVSASQPRTITPQMILETTAAAYGFSVDELCGHNRRRPLVLARQVGMYVFREATNFSYPAIAKEFGGRDHTTVMHAVDKIAALMKERRQIYDQVTDLILSIKSGA